MKWFVDHCRGWKGAEFARIPPGAGPQSRLSPPSSATGAQTFAGGRNLASPRRSARVWLLLLVAGWLLFGPQTIAQTGAPQEYELKLAWLYKLLKYADWSADGSDSSDPLVVGFLGKHDFGAGLDALEQQSVKGRKIEVRQLSSLSDYRDCQVIFIAASEKDRLPQILETLKRTSILTVGETGGFIREGGIINLVAERNRVQVEINNEAALRSGITISSQLLRWAKLVNG